MVIQNFKEIKQISKSGVPWDHQSIQEPSVGCHSHVLMKPFSHQVDL